MSKVKVAVIGCGWWTTFAHLPAITEHPDAEIAALADPDERRLAAAAEAFEVDASFATAEEMLDAVKPDAAVIAVPHALHHPIARLTLGHGLPTLLEKPMVIEPRHGRELLDLAAERGAELLIDYPWHYNRHALTIRKELADGVIGPIEHVSCLYASTVRELYRGDPEPYRDLWGYPVNAPGTTTYSDPALSGGGQGQTQITHAAALMLWLTGLRPHKVSAFSSNFELPVDLADGVAIRFHGGAVGVLSSTGAVLPGHDEIARFEIFGRDGHVLLDVNRGTASIHVAGMTKNLLELPRDQRNPEHAPARNLIDLVLGRAGNGSPGEIGLGAVEFVAAMYRSARDGRVVDLADV